MTDLLEILRLNETVFLSAVAVLGLIIGSFLNVVIYRLPIMLERQWLTACRDTLQTASIDSKCQGSMQGIANEIPVGEADSAEERFDLIKPNSRCPDCRRPIQRLENIPLLSYLWLRGKCAGCHARISMRYPLVELLTAALSVIVAHQLGFGWPVVWALVLTWVFVALSLIDYDCQLLPDVITLPVLWLGILINLQDQFVTSYDSIIGAVAGYLSLWMVYQLFKLATGKEGMGYGDFKLLALIGAWVGWQLLPVVILLSSLAGAVIGILLIVTKKQDKNKPIPFGPYLAIAGWCALLWGQALTDQYLAMIGMA